MRYLIILLFLIISCNNGSRNDEQYDSKTMKDVYDICYKSTYDAFKDMSEKMFKDLNDDVCGDKAAYNDKKLVKLCEKACKDAFNDYKKVKK